MCECSVFPVINLKGTGSNIENCRREAGLSVRDLQDYFGFEYPQAIYKWQHGECLPTVDNLLALSRILEVKMEDLLVYEDQEVSFCMRADHSPGLRSGCHFSTQVAIYCRSHWSGSAGSLISIETSYPFSFAASSKWLSDHRMLILNDRMGGSEGHSHA